MKKRITKIGALALGVVIMAASGLTAAAAERSYTYNYDYWGDVQDSPDAYAVSNVYTSVDFGLELGLKSPEGMFVKGDLLYICDTGNNRILELERVSREKFEIRRIIDSFQGNVAVKTFSGPTDISVSEEGDFYIADIEQLISESIETESSSVSEN